MQGDVFGSLMWSKTVDTFGKKCLGEKKHLCICKVEVEVPPLSMVDDIVSVSECDQKTTQIIAFLNSKAIFKKLQFYVNKCKKDTCW